MRTKLKIFVSFFSVLSILLILACNLSAPAPTPLPPTAVVVPTLAPPPEPTAITHQVFPVNLPAERTGHAGDYDAAGSAANKEAPGGDRFSRGQYERPFNAVSMDTYFSCIDIIDTLTYQDDTWLYGTITLMEEDKNGGLPGKYALEIDLNCDGKGDWLVMVTNPTSTTWSTDRMQVWQDTNKDVGGSVAVLADASLSSGDGYDRLVFDNGMGKDPDAAWARISPEWPTAVEIAVKRQLLGDTTRYMVKMWAGFDSLNPALFDFNDHMTHEQAGAAARGLPVYYPIKGLAELDNSCYIAVGFQPKGNEPGLCEVMKPGGGGGVVGCPNICPPTHDQLPYPDCRCVPP